MKLARGGVQIEIVANLFVMMFAGLALVAVAVVSLAARVAREDALERLRMGSRRIEAEIDAGAERLRDFAAVARAAGPRVVGGDFRVLDEQGRVLLGEPLGLAERREVEALLQAARGGGEVIEEGSLASGELAIVTPVRSRAGEDGFLLGRASGAEFRARLAPLLVAAAWVLSVATVVFVAFGTWLLRRRVVLPLGELARGTARIAGGDLAARLRPQGPAELAELAGAFNRMAEALEGDRAALERAHDALARGRRLASVGQLAAGVAHEVGNPVAAILGYAEVCQRERGASERTRELAERIGEEALRIRALVREMLDLSRPDALAVERADTAALVGRLAERVRGQPLLVGIELALELEAELPAVDVDPRRVEQILVNLVENAAHALRGGEAPRIEIAARRTRDPARPARRATDRASDNHGAERAPDSVAISVSDNGPGIDAEHLPYVFDPFFTTKDPGEGTGLGLWNAHRLAEILGGRLEVASQSGRTCFSLVLPAADTSGGHGQTPRADHR
ncbi:MAG TPA: HAMP domain-containing sensor histidine kinase [Myxococcota bacterium]|nr:HAMP domain-containing sensor histidine kinase [Myxococcota bacterium]